MIPASGSDLKFLSNEAAIDAELERRRLDTERRDLESFRQDPYGFVMWAFPWGRAGTPLEKFAGPDAWQKDFLLELEAEVKKRNFDGRTAVAPIRMARTSGHGIGKGVLCGMLTTYIMSTRPYSQGTITANTFTQLETKTWATIQRWFRLSRTAGDFAIGANGIHHLRNRDTWFCSPQTCREENSEAFAGQHAVTAS